MNADGNLKLRRLYDKNEPFLMLPSPGCGEITSIHQDAFKDTAPH